MTTKLEKYAEKNEIQIQQKSGLVLFRTDIEPL